MANPNNDFGSSNRGPFTEGGSSSQGASASGASPFSAAGGSTASASASGHGERMGSRASDGVARSTVRQEPTQRYSFRALVAMGLIGFAVGRLCSR
ncbi:hypothetical protein [Ancylobacter rudongensis]|uniref:Uncharacterized protein n=1 Tax=Ancylobacter rudongensis TaxID=177413 RepID=A0A1G4PVM1_9HYPH|nr:hypothetical protein [Ancylobacter rudongensis]SCW36350.1 hypothetical protein SAMN05660859_0804 [Ancylobacter rudongensis]